MSILEWQVAGAPLAILDVETTGLNPGFDRIVELSVVHLDGAGEPQLAFDSLIDPRREIPSCPHGITGRDVYNAPLFSEVANSVLTSLCGRVIVAHNAYFDIRFLSCELTPLGIRLAVPYLCSMDLRPALGLGSRVTLVDGDSCRNLYLDDQQIRRRWLDR